MKRHKLILFVFITVALTSCTDKKDMENTVITWDNSIHLPPCDGMDINKGIAGAYAGFVGSKLILTGGANFPEGYPWTGGKKTWWKTLYSYDTKIEQWTIYNDFLEKALAYGISIQMQEGVLCIGGGDAERCYNDVFLIREEEEEIRLEKDIYPSLPVPLANMSGALLNGKIYLAGGQEAMIPEKSTNHFFALETKAIEKGWVRLPEWPGPPLAYSICVAQDNKIFIFSGRSFGPGEETIMHTDGYCFDPESNEWTKLDKQFPVMAGTAMPYKKDKILFFGGVEQILPTTPEHPGFSKQVKIYDIAKNILDSISSSPYPIAVTTTLVRDSNKVYICSRELKPGIWNPHILKAVISDN